MERNSIFNKRICSVLAPNGSPCRGIIIAGLLLITWLCASCAKLPQAAPPLLAPPVNALSQNDLLGRQSISQVKECIGNTTQPSEKDPVAELLLIYVSSRRDFRAPEGPDGYLFRLVPLDKSYHPIPVKAEVTIALYRDQEWVKSHPGSDPLRIWQIPTQQIENHWVISQDLAGYFFRLDWGLQGPGPGNYRVLVRFDYFYNEKNITICRAMTFQDMQGQLQM
jgi:hypothetical protein